MDMISEQAEIAQHRKSCSAARRANGNTHLPAALGGCYWAEDGYWISCNEVFEIMRKHERMI